MIMQTVKLHDNIDMERSDTPGIVLKTNLPFLPVNENNLMYRAAKMLMDEFHLEGGVRMSLRKVIPVAAGMAGGSADAGKIFVHINCKIIHHCTCPPKKVVYRRAGRPGVVLDGCCHGSVRYTCFARPLSFAESSA